MRFEPPPTPSPDEIAAKASSVQLPTPRIAGGFLCGHELALVGVTTRASPECQGHPAVRAGAGGGGSRGGGRGRIESHRLDGLQNFRDQSPCRR